MSDKENKSSESILKELEAMSPEEQQKVLRSLDTFSKLGFGLNVDSLKKQIEENGLKPINNNDIGALSPQERFELAKSVQAGFDQLNGVPVFKPRSISTPPYEAKPGDEALFEIPRDENGKIDIAKLPEEIRDTIELISQLFSESTAESEAIIEQMIKVAHENTAHFDNPILTNLALGNADKVGIGPRNTMSFMDMPFDFPIIRQKQMGSRVVGEAETTGLDLIRQSRTAALALNRAPSVEPTQEQREEFERQQLEARSLSTPSYENVGRPVRVFGETEALEDTRIFSKPILQGYAKGMTTFFDSVRAQRELYKGLIVRLNKEIEQGPLAGLIFVTGVMRAPAMSRAQLAVFKEDIMFNIEVKMTKDRSGNLRPSFKAGNRTRAYLSYYGNLFEKYRQEIRDAEAKVMERE